MDEEDENIPDPAIFEGEDSEDLPVRYKHVTEEAGDAFFTSLAEAGVLTWDGFEKSKSLGKYVLDGDNGFEIKLLLSDGTTMHALGSNIYPAYYSEVSRLIFEQFNDLY